MVTYVRHQRLLKGLCTRCGTDAKKEGRYCIKCKTRGSEYNRKSRFK